MTGTHHMDKSAAWPATRPSLLVSMKAGDETAWQTFVDLYVPLLHAFCRRRSVPAADAEEISEAVLTKVLHFDYRPQRGLFRGWLGTVLRREIADFRRRVQRGQNGAGGSSPVGSLDENGASVDPEWDDAFQARVLRAALERVRPEFAADRWEAFVSTWLEDGVPERVAAKLGRAVGWVYQAKLLVLRRLEAEVLFLAEDSVLLLRR